MLRVPLLTIKSPADLGYLRYERKPIEKKQRRFEGRYALIPEVQLYEFECRAVIDWIVVRLVTGRATQHQWIQQVVEPEVGRRCHIDVVDETPGRVSNVFEIRFQEPDLGQVKSVCRLLEEKFELQMLPVIAAIEVSVDFRSSFRDILDRAKLFTVLTRHFYPARDVLKAHRDRPRFSFGGGKDWAGVLGRTKGRPDLDDYYFTSLDTDQPPFVDSTYYVGADEADIRWRIMDKVVDTQNRAAGTFFGLDDIDKRVRIEVTLDRSAIAGLGVEYLTDLPRLRFAQLQSKFFSFVLPTFADTNYSHDGAPRAVRFMHERKREQKFLATGVIGLAAMDGAWARRVKAIRKDAKVYLRRSGRAVKPIRRVGRGSTGDYLAYEELNERVGVALRHLGERVAASLSRC